MNTGGPPSSQVGGGGSASGSPGLTGNKRAPCGEQTCHGLRLRSAPRAPSVRCHIPGRRPDNSTFRSVCAEGLPGSELLSFLMPSLGNPPARPPAPPAPQPGPQTVLLPGARASETEGVTAPLAPGFTGHFLQFDPECEAQSPNRPTCHFLPLDPA